MEKQHKRKKNQKPAWKCELEEVGQAAKNQVTVTCYLWIWEEIRELEGYMKQEKKMVTVEKILQNN